tara:strand:- start:2286 stop:3470 length:1185 start_codon:yes stop_codon:yes gene_type:complete
MANYLDLMNQLQDRRRAELSEYQPQNPYDGSAYSYQSAQDMYNQGTADSLQSEAAEGYIPSDMYTPPTTADKVTSGMSNVNTASSMVTSLSPVASQVGNQLVAKGATAAPPQMIAASGPVTAGGSAPMVANPAAGMSAGASGTVAALAYTMANDNNPYTYKGKEAVGMGVGDYMAATTATTMLGIAAPWLPIAVAGLGYLFRSKKAKKLKSAEKEIKVEASDNYGKYMQEDRERMDLMTMNKNKQTGNTVYGGATPNYGLQANKGMKYSYNSGGVALENVTAEFTGNELIVNNQDQVEQGLKNKDYTKAAAPIREAMRSNMVTPGPETHKNNPMPVTSDGSIYAAGGQLPFKVGNGAGVYDHATDQFKSTMSDKEISMVAQKNIKKWKSNNMYS